MNKNHLRDTLIQQRSKLNKAQLHTAAYALKETAQANQALQMILSSANRILSYFAFNGEITPNTLTDSLSAKIYLPKIVDYQNKLMHFFPAEQAQTKNRYGIFEPIGNGQSLALAQFDLVLMPLVAFDQQGNRIGMGGGFYDRAIANSSSRPLLIGLAHDFQQQQTIQPEVWDVPIDVILTNREIIDPANTLQR